MRPPRRHRARHLATFPAECSVLRSRGGAIVTRCPACNRRADKSRHGRTEKYKERNMNCKTWTRIIALTLFAALAIPVQLAAQDRTQPQQDRKSTRLNSSHA